ncbi:glucokinase regulatory protein-like [Littorina saxatilis]|uniref:SIS domain-containing protein n=1 Tax=Littorina saxatilis TaxID=31220 RepID=A0AAN9B9Q6_9CAEN
MDLNTDQPITERTNPLSANIDILAPLDIVSTLQACDEEIFNGWRDFQGLFDERIQSNLSKIMEVAVDVLNDADRSVIIFSGCGTSGRLAFITARTFNSHLRHLGITECYQYIMAGGDRALFTSQEAVEDDPLLGAKILKQLSEDKVRVLYFGITCGLSAPFIAGQLDYCLKHLDRFTPVLLGFNPAHLARNMPIEKWDKTFLQVVQRLEEAEAKGQGFILNPVVGPEPITGSSRMKSGTATKLLLEAVLMPAHAKSFMHTKLGIKDYLVQYKQVWESVYSQKSDIAALLHLAGSSLKQGGHLYYIGSGGLGIMGLIDASECSPTYGATLDDVRGFLEGGYQTLANLEGDLSSLGKHFGISLQDFMDQIVPNLTDRDLVIFISKDRPYSIPKEVEVKPCNKACIVVNITKGDSVQSVSTFNSKVTLDLTEVVLDSAALDADLRLRTIDLYAELAVKWTLNAVSTGAHIMKGKVFNNIMIDLKPSNVKLFHRAVGIIQRYSNLAVEVCQDYLLRSLYDTDDVSQEIRSAAMVDHIKIGASKPKVVPTALLAALLRCTIREAKVALDQQPVLRQVILDSMAGQQGNTQ